MSRIDTSAEPLPPFCDAHLVVSDARMIDATAWRKGRETKTAWEGVVMVVGDDVGVLRLEGRLIHVVLRENATN